MRYRYAITDVFTERRFGGNQLAVLPEAQGLSTAQMQQIAREFNFSESAFVFPAEQGHTRKVRIFTPAREVPFAGHPNIGTAFTLATLGALGELPPSATITFEEQAGLVPITITREGASIRCELSAPEPLSVGEPLDPALVAAALSLAPEDILSAVHPPRMASVGLPFIFAELRDRAALTRARSHLPGAEALQHVGLRGSIHLYVRSGDDFDLRARMFAPLTGVPEDPATGSANCALAGLLAQCDPEPTGELRWRVAQGVEMGRPSVLELRAVKQGGALRSTHVGGTCALFAEGELHL